MKDPCETFFCPYEEEEQARSVNLWEEAFGGGFWARLSFHSKPIFIALDQSPMPEEEEEQ